MTVLSALLAAVTVAFPAEGQRLPPLDRCYLVGASDGVETSLVVSASASAAEFVIPVARTGAWGTLVPVVSGTNVITVGDAVRTIVVAPKQSAPVESASPKAYAKLDYAADAPAQSRKRRAAKDVMIVIDAGHGGEDGGAMSPHGLPEKDANLRLARAVVQALSRMGLTAVMTRQTDVFLPLYDRPRVAHAGHADAFVSIHHNAPGYASNPLTTRYRAVYAWNGLGERLAAEIARATELVSPVVASRGVLHANFAVTRSPEIPSCLVEADFITHPDGESAAWDPYACRRLGEAIARGVVTWCEKCDIIRRQ